MGGFNILLTIVFWGAIFYGIYRVFFAPKDVEKKRLQELATPVGDPSLTFRAAINELDAIKSRVRNGLNTDDARALLNRDLPKAAAYAHTLRTHSPDATYTTEGDSPYTYTIDQLAAELLYYESVLAWSAAPETYTPLTPFTEPLKFRHNPKLMQQAITAIDKAIAYRPQNTHFHYTRANILRTLKRKEDAILALNKALELDPKNVDAFQLRTNIINEAS